MSSTARAARRLATVIVVALGLLATQGAVASAAVVLNEINCEGTDWVELVNTSGTDADISGWLLTDKPLDSTDATHRLVFPAATSVPANGLLVVNKGTGGFPFGISCGDDVIKLADQAGTEVDSYAVPTQAGAGDTFGRVPNGTGAFVETLPTKGTPNEPSDAGGGPPVDHAAWLYDPAQVVRIDLTLPQSSQDALALDPDTYVHGSFSLAAVGGSYSYADVGIRLKGGVGSFRPLTGPGQGKSAFKIKFNEFVAGQRFVGLKKLTLNNMVQDLSMTHEVLGYELFRGVGVPAPRTGFAYVKVNGEDFGVYLDVETPDDVSLAHQFATTLHLYEGEYSADVTPGGAGAFQVDEGSSGDLTDLEALIDAANQTAGDWSDGMAPVADLSEITHMWAVEKYIGNWDGYSGRSDANHKLPNNYFLHSDAAGKFSMLPWGIDQTWDEHLPFDGAPDGLLFNKCLADISCAALYRTAVQDLVAALPGLNLDTLAANTAALLKPWQDEEELQSTREEYSADRVAVAVTSTRDFIAARPAEAEAWLNPPPPTDPPPTVPTESTPAPAAPPVIAPSTPPLKPLGVGKPAFAGGVITTRFDLPGPGRVSQRAFSTVRGHIRTACLVQATRAAAGRVTLRCRLSAEARRRLRAGTLGLTLRNWFVPASGRAEMVLRRLTVARQAR